MVSYAAAGPNTRTTEVFINLVNNSAKLDKMGFAPFGQVVEGMTATVDKFYSGYGEIAEAGGNGPDPNQMKSQGNQYLEINFPKIDFIKSAELVQPTGAPAAGK
jgi:peptidyl-prolyl cis-trans isomerase A (cyclophilin A)